MSDNREFCLIGETLRHSMSPQIHKKLFEISDMQGNYYLREINKDNFGCEAKELKKLTGYNITIPYKVDIIPFLDKIDTMAKKYGAVNCVYNNKGISTGYNTDVDGFLKSLEVNHISLNKKVLLLGLGGVGRMMAFEAVSAGAELTVAVRENSVLKSQTIIDDIKSKCKCADIKLIEYKDISGHFDTLINSTPVGMYPHGDKCPVSDEVIKNCDAVFDAIYNPVKTQLVAKALSMGKTAVGGMEMLVYQAVVAHEIWDNAEYKTSDIKKVIEEMEDEVTREFI